MPPVARERRPTRKMPNKKEKIFIPSNDDDDDASGHTPEARNRMSRDTRCLNSNNEKDLTAPRRWNGLSSRGTPLDARPLFSFRSHPATLIISARRKRHPACTLNPPTTTTRRKHLKRLATRETPTRSQMILLTLAVLMGAAASVSSGQSAQLETPLPTVIVRGFLVSERERLRVKARDNIGWPGSISPA